MAVLEIFDESHPGSALSEPFLNERTRCSQVAREDASNESEQLTGLSSIRPERFSRRPMSLYGAFGDKREMYFAALRMFSIEAQHGLYTAESKHKWQTAEPRASRFRGKVVARGRSEPTTFATRVSRSLRDVSVQGGRGAVKRGPGRGLLRS
jgi:hypothetical protein